MQVVLPGDIVRTAPATAQIRLGPGVVQIQQKETLQAIQLAATKSGILGAQQIINNKKASAANAASCWIESQAKRYIPALGEPVIGVIVARHAEGYRVDIGAAQHAALDALAFEDATKRNKPNLKVGTVIYARVTLALPFCEPELECFDPKTGKAQGFGDLSEGMLIRNLELSKCRALLSPSHPLLPSIGAKFPFELAIGVNGRIWVKAADIEKTIQLMRAIQEA